MRPFFRAAFFLSLLLFPGPSANAYVRTMADTGLPLYWTSPNISFRVNPQNSSGLGAAQVSTQLSAAFSSWSVSGTRAQTQYSQSTSYPANSNFDGVNTVYFTSASGHSMDYGVVALTEVTYYLNSGQIAEADMSFNDGVYRFTDNEGDTGRTIGGRTAIYLRDVATHETGHAFGIDHSIVNLSSLIYTAFSGQYALSGDDRTAIRTMYPNGAAPGGSLTGTVLGSRGGIFGAHVEAINLETGAVAAGTLANPDGSFRLGDIPAGQYAVLMEPFSADISSVSSYFQNVNHRFCPSSAMFRRRFYGPCGTNEAAVVEVRAGDSTGLGALAPSCSQMGNPAGSPTSIAHAISFPAEGGARFGTLLPGETHYYRLDSVAGSLKARALSYSLYSPVDVKVDILDENGDPLAGAVSVDNVQDPMPGGFVNYDSSAEATVPGGNYLVRVRSGLRLYSNVYPAGFDLLDGSGHYLLALSVNGAFGPSGTADMSACALVNNTAQSASYRAPASTQEKKSGGGCGTLSGGGGSPWGGGPLQLTLFALCLQLVIWGRRLKAALVRKRR